MPSAHVLLPRSESAREAIRDGARVFASILGEALLHALADTQPVAPPPPPGTTRFVIASLDPPPELDRCGNPIIEGELLDD
jgi:hypothetical protein